MAIKVLVVDDSIVVCKKIKQILENTTDVNDHSEFKVIGFAGNGLEAIRMTSELKPDVITMDVEMPVMDGIAAVKSIMNVNPTPILMFSAMTKIGAQATLDALDAGAVDFLPKHLNDINTDVETAKKLLRRRVLTVALQSRNSHAQQHNIGAKIHSVAQTGVVNERHHALPANLKLIVIAASTGGPIAVQKILTRLPKTCPVPVLVIQHMPQDFTRSFAERLDQLCQIKVAEANHGDLLKAGEVLVAPGGMQLELRNSGQQKQIVLRAKTPDEIYSPCADVAFQSVARCYSGGVLALVLTGMGADGKEGAAKLKKNGATVWAQNQDSCTIYGMPKAVVESGLADQVLSLDELAQAFARVN